MRIVMSQAEYDKLMNSCLEEYCHRCPFHSKDGVTEGVCAAEWLKEQKIIIVE